MPFFLHGIGADPSTGSEYPDKPAALADRQDGQTVTFVASDSERATWQARERRRLLFGHYVAVPWADDLYSVATDYHFAHVSLDVPGMIAYTPDDERGILDRQTRVKPGRYLQQFFADKLSADQIADWASRVKAYTSDLQLAITPDDIARVYCANDGPSSCMDGRHFGFERSPARAYGNSDLAVAYIGTLSEGNDRHSRIAARAVVWPERKIFGRIYGDEGTLRHVLSAAGYQNDDMTDARIRAIDTDHGYLCPYIDGISSASLSSCGKWLILDDSGDIDVQNTTGYASGSTCAHCGSSCSADESYCSSCDDDRHYCDRCGNDYFGDDEGSYSDARSEWFCQSCWDRMSRSCAHCDESFNAYDFSRRDWENRSQDLCEECHDNVTSCSDCGEYTDDRDDDDRCPDCRKCSDCGAVAEQFADLDRQERCEPCARKRHNRTPARPIGRILRLHRAGVPATLETIRLQIKRGDGSPLDTVDAIPVAPNLYLHRTIDRDDHWTITHGPTGLAVSTLIKSESYGRSIANHLRDHDWSFVDPCAIPPATSSQARATIALYRNAGGIV